MLNKLTIKEINPAFIQDLQTNYIMDLFKYTYEDLAGNVSEILDCTVDSIRQGLITIGITDINAIRYKSITLYYKNSIGKVYTKALVVDNLDGLFFLNITNRLFIDLYKLVSDIKCKFRFTLPTSFVQRHFHRKDMFSYFTDINSTKFSDSLSLVDYINKNQQSQITLELNKDSIIAVNNLGLSYNAKWYKNTSTDDIDVNNIFYTDGLDLIPSTSTYIRYHEFNNKEYIIMTNIRIPILGEDLEQITYDQAENQYILVSDGLPGGNTPSRKMTALSVRDLTDRFINVITVWEATKTYKKGDWVRSPLTDKIYYAFQDVPVGQNPVYYDRDGNGINADAGEYWGILGNGSIGDITQVYLTKAELNLRRSQFQDEYAIIGDSGSGHKATWYVFASGKYFLTSFHNDGSGWMFPNLDNVINQTNHGRYLRCLSYSDSGYDGTYTREDVFKAHNHTYQRTDTHDGYYYYAHNSYSEITASVPYTSNTSSVGAEETRGKEVLVYTLIKVR